MSVSQDKKAIKQTDNWREGLEEKAIVYIHQIKKNKHELLRNKKNNFLTVK